jgi:membrane-anchored protein YejM (alkaline phosphatase superfamily)
MKYNLGDTYMKNIILLTVDTLRYDYFDPIKKAADEVLGLGLECENAYATGPATPFSFLGILCSKYSIAPDEDITYKTDKPRQYIHTPLNKNPSRISLSEILVANGYHSYTIPNNPYVTKSMYGLGTTYLDYEQHPSVKIQHMGRNLTTPIMPLYHLARSIWRIIGKSVVDRLVKRSNDTTMAYYTASESNLSMKQLISGETGPFFIHLNYMDVHGPYHKEIDKFSDLGEGYRKSVNTIYAEWTKHETMDKKDAVMFKEMYYRSTFYVAQKIKDLLLDLKQKGVLENSLVILASDHGQLFDQYGLTEHAFPLKTHTDAKNLLCKELLHVPLVFYGFGPGKIKKKVSLIDLAPTILDIVGIKPPDGWYGTSIFTEDKKPVVSEVRAIGYNITSIATEEAIFSYTEQSKSWLQPGKTEQEKGTEDLDKVLEEHKKQKEQVLSDAAKYMLKKKLIKLKTTSEKQ